MITHIVFFTFKEKNKRLNILKAKQMIEDLRGKIDFIKAIEVGVNFDEASRAMDMSLYSKFDSVEDLGAYTIHPEHLKVVEFIKSVTVFSKVVDYNL